MKTITKRTSSFPCLDLCQTKADGVRLVSDYSSDWTLVYDSDIDVVSRQCDQSFSSLRHRDRTHARDVCDDAPVTLHKIHFTC